MKNNKIDFPVKFKHFRTFIGQVAQLVEQRPEKPCVAGSIPALSTILLRVEIILLNKCRDARIRTGDLLLPKQAR